MIKIRHKGGFKKTTKFLKESKKASDIDLKEYGIKGVEALMSATPVKTGKTANSWYYEIIKENGKTKILFNNSNIQNGINIALILQTGHATNSGYWIEGRDYIDPAIQPIFDELASKAWKEVTK